MHDPSLERVNEYTLLVNAEIKHKNTNKITMFNISQLNALQNALNYCINVLTKNKRTREQQESKRV